MPWGENVRGAMDSKTTATDGLDPVSDSQTKQSKNQNTDKTEPAHQPGETKSAVRRAPD